MLLLSVIPGGRRILMDVIAGAAAPATAILILTIWIAADLILLSAAALRFRRSRLVGI